MIENTCFSITVAHVSLCISLSTKGNSYCLLLPQLNVYIDIHQPETALNQYSLEDFVTGKTL